MAGTHANAHTQQANLVWDAVLCSSALFTVAYTRNDSGYSSMGDRLLSIDLVSLSLVRLPVESSLLFVLCAVFVCRLFFVEICAAMGVCTVSFVLSSYFSFARRVRACVCVIFFVLILARRCVCRPCYTHRTAAIFAVVPDVQWILLKFLFNLLDLFDFLSPDGIVCSNVDLAKKREKKTKEETRTRERSDVFGISGFFAVIVVVSIPLNTH